LFHELYQGHLSLSSCPPLPEGGPLNIEVASSDPKACETTDGQGEGEAEGSSKGTGSTQSLPSAALTNKDEGSKRKHQEEVVSSGTSKETPQDKSSYSKAPLSMFDLLDSDA
jgi:hypothetical protein